MKIDDTFHGISTLLLVKFRERQIQGSGFFYQELGPKDSEQDAQWRTVEEVWIVTNRHVLLPELDGEEIVPDEFVFHLRRIVNNQIVWDPVVLGVAQLRERARLHSNHEVDVAMIRVDDLLKERLQTSNTYPAWSFVTEEHLPGNNNISVEVADDVVVIGYPKGFYDQTNVFPIVKSGIIATRWGMHFDGLPMFLIDAKLFPGSSGSLVITKPIDLVVADGKPMYAKEKQFAFLGVYSGEPFREYSPIDLPDMTIIPKDTYDVGIVWYGQLVVDIARTGNTL